MNICLPEVGSPQDLVQEHLARLDVFSESVQATLYRKEGTVCFEADPESLLTVFGDIPFSSGFLPKNTLFFERRGPKERIAVYLPRCRRTLQVQTEEDSIAQWTIPLPPLIFMGDGQEARVFALSEPIESARQRLFAAPFPNIHENSGSICFGNNKVPAASVNTLDAMQHLFFTSLFNGDLVSGKSKKFPEDVRKHLSELSGKKSFPTGDLVPYSNTIHDLIGFKGREDRGGEYEPY